MVKQVSVFVENKIGKIMEILSLLAENNIDLKALSVADATDFGVMRMVVSDVELTKKLLIEDGVIVKISEIIAVAVPDEPGALMKTFSILSDNTIAIEYMYAFAEKLDDYSLIAIRTDKPEEALTALKDGGVRILDNSDIEKL